ncbi:unnamed protein product [Linum trigynum]|uniref:Uncharacterized protein n=1 Tax=Linum trigynum TaxID=586398 RepID=A0AAV2DSD2_9ROSI
MFVSSLKSAMVYAFALTYSGTMFHEPALANYHRHVQSFANRLINPSTLVHIPAFVPLGLDVMPLIQNLGWEFLLTPVATSTLICPEAVRTFFSNLRYFVLQSRTLSTLVHGHLITLPLHDISRLLRIPAFGEALAHPVELSLFNFDVVSEAVHLTGHEPDHDLTFSSGLLMPSLQTFHYLLTRVFLPRTVFLDRVIPLDLWIMSHVVADVPLDFSHLLFGALLPFIDHNFHAPLSFGAMITRLLLALPLNLSAYRTETPTLWLTAADVLEEIGIAIEGEDDPYDPFAH